MLTNLHIRNFTIIDSSELDLGQGMSALTGETGAGKSILLDAIGLVLGDRGDSGTVRKGCTRADISADFQPRPESPVWQWMQENDLDDEDQCLLRRVISAEGKSRAYINGHLVSNRVLSAVGEMLVDIHGQHEHYRLTERSTQRELLDSMLPNRRLAEQVAECYFKWTELSERISQLTNHSTQRAERMDMLRFQILEFEALDLEDKELETIESDYSRMANAGELMQLATSTLDCLDRQETSAYTQLNRALKNLSDLQIHDESIVETAEIVNTASILVSEASAALYDYTNKLEVDPDELQKMDTRLSDLHGLAKKHQTDIRSLATVLKKLKSGLEEYVGDNEGLDALREECTALEVTYFAQAKKLSKLRKKTAKSFDKSVTETMHSLGMDGGGFHCEVVACEGKPLTSGIDEIRFTVSPNPGMEAGDLRKIASGGELSRISLAIALVSTNHDRVPTLIFDEVDAGIGGGIAETVGKHLRTLGKTAQVLCVTHLPQVAAQAHNHLLVSKTVENGETRTDLRTLEKNERVEEIARMLGGTKRTRKSQQHAKEMLENAN